MRVHCRSCCPPTWRGSRLPATRTCDINLHSLTGSLKVVQNHYPERQPLTSFGFYRHVYRFLPILSTFLLWWSLNCSCFLYLKNGIFVDPRVFTAIYLEEVAVDHSDDQQHLVIGHIASAHLESRGWDVNPTVRHWFFSLNTQKLIRTGKRIKSEYHVYVQKIWPHFLRHIYPQMVEVKMSQSLPTGGNFPLITPINTHLIS